MRDPVRLRRPALVALALALCACGPHPAMKPADAEPMASTGQSDMAGAQTPVSPPSVTPGDNPDAGASDPNAMTMPGPGMEGDETPVPPMDMGMGMGMTVAPGMPDPALNAAAAMLAGSYRMRRGQQIVLVLGSDLTFMNMGLPSITASSGTFGLQQGKLEFVAGGKVVGSFDYGSDQDGAGIASLNIVASSGGSSIVLKQETPGPAGDYWLTGTMQFALRLKTDGTFQATMLGALGTATGSYTTSGSGSGEIDFADATGAALASYTFAFSADTLTLFGASETIVLDRD
jgi:hypothetical protein